MTNTKVQLIKATRELIAIGGEGFLSVRKITARAGTNVAAVNYHFGSKEKLVAAAKAELPTPEN